MAAERRIKRPLRENSYFAFEQWQFPEDPEHRIIGRNVRPKEDVDRITGKGLFSHDIVLPGMLYAKWYISPYAHARVRKINIDNIKSMPGVHDILTCSDPDVQMVGSPEGLAAVSVFRTKDISMKRPDIAFVLPCEAFHEGQPVALAVAAESPDICDYALSKAGIEWEELPFVVDRDEAMRPGAPIAQLFRQQESNIVDPIAADLAPWLPWVSRETMGCERGDLRKGFEESDAIIEFELKTGINGWGGGGIEPFAAVAYLHEGHLDLWTRALLSAPISPGSIPGSGLNEHSMVAYAASLAGVSLSNVQVHIPYSGSSFGGINWNGNHAIPTLLATILSKRTGRPVMVLADWTSFSAITNEEAGHYWFRVGFKKDGTITALELKSNANWGTAGLVIPGCDKLYKSTAIRNCRCASIGFPYLNVPPAACYKHGSLEAIPFNEVFSRVAAALGKDPIEVALKNDGIFGNPMHPDGDHVKRTLGLPLRDSLVEVIEAGKSAINWGEKWHPPGTKRLPNGRYHGLGFAWLEEWRPAPSRPALPAARAVLNFSSDGTVLIRGLRVPIGNHEKSTYCQIVAEEAGLRYEDVTMDHEYNGSFLEPGNGARGLARNAAIMKELGVKAKIKILEVASEYFHKKAEELDVVDGIIFERMNSNNKISVADLVKIDYNKFSGEITADGESVIKASDASVTKNPYFGRQAAFLEVEVDPDTGKIDIKRLVIANDLGRVINPGSVAGQQYGGAYMGIGRAMTEEIVYDPNTGVKLNDNLTWHRVLTMADVFRVDAIAVETGLGYSAYGNIGVGEDPNALTRSLIRSAVHNALGVWVDEDPITPDRVLKALGKANLRAEASR